MDEHASRFRETEYHYNNWVLFNLAMKSAKIVLPSDSTVHDRVLTYVHQENALYRGKTKIKQPAVLALEPVHSFKYTPLLMNPRGTNSSNRAVIAGTKRSRSQPEIAGFKYKKKKRRTKTVQDNDCDISGCYCKVDSFDESTQLFLCIKHSSVQKHEINYCV
jgi:hypothetical protein